MAELTKREMEILLLLLRERDWVTGEEISQRLNISRKTVRQEIRMIEEVLGAEGGLCAGQKRGYRIEGLSEEQLQQVLLKLEENEEHRNMKDRTSVLALCLLFQRDYVTMDRLAELFFLSKSTVFSEVKTLKRWMGRQGGISLEVSGVHGVRVLGREQDCRFRCAAFCMPGILRQIPLEKEEQRRYEKELAVIRRELGRRLSRQGCLICGEDFGKVCRYLAVSLLRDRLGFSMGEEDRRREEGFGKEEKAVREILPELETALDCRFSEEAVAGLAELLACARLPGGASVSCGERNGLPEDGREGESRQKQLESALRELLELPSDRQLFRSGEQFRRHFLRMEKRLRWGRSATNYYDKELAVAEPLETCVTELACRRVFGQKLPRAERMLLAAWLDPASVGEEEGVSVLLVSDQSAAVTSGLEAFVRQSLSGRVSRFTAEPAYQFEAEGGNKGEYGLALTTEGGTALLHPEFIRLPAVLRPRDRGRAERLLREWEEGEEERKIREILERYGKEERTLEGGGRLPDLLEAIGWEGEETSVAPLEDELLYLCRFRKGEEPWIRLYRMERPAEVEKKSIRKVLAVSWNGEKEGRAAFFRAVSRLLEEGGRSCSKKVPLKESPN